MLETKEIQKKDSIEKELKRVPIVNWLVLTGKRIPVPGLQGMSLYDLLEMYSLGILKGALTSRAGGISYSFFMALFPFMLFMLTLIPYIPIDGFQENFLGLISEVLPPKTFTAVDSVLADIATNKYGGLLSFGFLVSIFLMTNGVNAVFAAFEYSVHVQKIRNVLKQYLISLGTSLTMSFMLILTVAATIFFEFGFTFLTENGWISESMMWLSNLRYLLFMFLIFCTVSMLYYFGTTEGKETRFFSAGSVLTTILSLLTFYGFGIYVVKFSKYNELYGSIGTLLVLMLFIWLNAIILLLGFELNASITRLRNDHKTAKASKLNA
ncbi:YihY/virulence factor BrkB family protein [Wenyingzhuangia sp. 2_MG-2023]|uniref:YihY/virulence factor BrkB family protein n=1 Tax=Wenyingzhuangia sp. 2_MG-2023 TaxID=3062639 RepID=UPI0026E23CC0|nr:YihY/virulence factor BrkB family protein [Wenyingzhuangia sp. 2_MG-2023]MDO6738542.1 YihY/virulence factor BrkB family protein [Wenyingzhuangia sp. 2_MG-2023]